MAILLNAPLQQYLNRAFKAEKATTAFSELVSTTSVHASVEPPKVADARDHAKWCNWRILSGDAGESALQKCNSLLGSYTCEQWADMQMSREQKFQLALCLLKMAAETWRTRDRACSIVTKSQLCRVRATNTQPKPNSDTCSKLPYDFVQIATGIALRCFTCCCAYRIGSSSFRNVRLVLCFCIWYWCSPMVGFVSVPLRCMSAASLPMFVIRGLLSHLFFGSR